MTGRSTGAIVAVLLLAMAAAAARAQERAGTDVLPALLTEVRGLRAAIEQMATAGAQVQLALGRLQLQEQRVNTSIRRLDETRARLAEVQRRISGEQDQLAMMEAAMKEGGGFGVEVHGQPAERVGAEGMLAHFRRGIARSQAEIQQLTAEETILAGEVASEQARWSALNGRLEELERDLERPSR